MLAEYLDETSRGETSCPFIFTFTFKTEAVDYSETSGITCDTTSSFNQKLRISVLTPVKI
jgi:hypothetical protein